MPCSRAEGTGTWCEQAPSILTMSRPMEDLVERLTRGNVTEVKVMLTSVALALAAYELVLISVGYGKVRPRFLEPRPAARAHRASVLPVLGISVFLLLAATWASTAGAFLA
jgi:hypothetical protein